MKEKITTQQRVDWLLKHPKLWEGYGDYMKGRCDSVVKIEQVLFDQMREAGLISKRTNWQDCAFWKWINQARKQRRGDKSKEQI